MLVERHPLADAAWAHAIGVVCLLGFMLVAFQANSAKSAIAGSGFRSRPRECAAAKDSACICRATRR